MCEIGVNERDEIAAKYFAAGWNSGVNECLLEIRALHQALQPLIAVAQAIPEAMESNPMMKMLLGRMSK